MHILEVKKEILIIWEIHKYRIYKIIFKEKVKYLKKDLLHICIYNIFINIIFIIYNRKFKFIFNWKY